MAGKSRWANPLIAAVATIGIFLILTAGSACAATINGIVTDSTGARVAGAMVTLYQDGQQYVFQDNPWTTDITGYYEFSPLPAGTYSLQADKDGYLSGTEMRILGGSDMLVDLKIPGYRFQTASPTIKPVYVTPAPTPEPTITPKPTPRPSPTLVPLPTPTPEPGFGLLLALLSLGAIVAIKRYR